MDPLLRRPSSYESHVSLAPPQHKTGTVLLQHLLKDACPILGWKCTFNDGERSECPTEASQRQSIPGFRPGLSRQQVPPAAAPDLVSDAWRSNHLAAVPTKCNGPEQARAAGLDMCFQQHGVRFKLGTVRA